MVALGRYRHAEDDVKRTVTDVWLNTMKAPCRGSSAARRYFMHYWGRTRAIAAIPVLFALESIPTT
jgi:hypothetical protein